MGDTRLRSCVEAAEPITVPIWFGCPKSALWRTDQGRSRTSDALSLQGEANAGVLARTVRILLGLLTQGSPHPIGLSISNDEVLAMLAAHPRLRESAQLAASCKFLPKAMLAVIHYLAAETSAQGEDGRRVRCRPRHRRRPRRRRSAPRRAGEAEQRRVVHDAAAGERKDVAAVERQAVGADHGRRPGDGGRRSRGVDDGRGRGAGSRHDRGHQRVAAGLDQVHQRDADHHLLQVPAERIERLRQPLAVRDRLGEL